MCDRRVYFEPGFIERLSRDYGFLFECIADKKLPEKRLKDLYEDLFWKEPDVDRDALRILASKEFYQVKQFLGFAKGTQKKWMWSIVLRNPKRSTDMGYLLINGGTFRDSFESYLLGSYDNSVSLFNEWGRVQQDNLRRGYDVHLNVSNIMLEPRENMGFNPYFEKEISSHSNAGPHNAPMKREFGELPFYEEEDHLHKLNESLKKDKASKFMD